jgi:isomaltose glucohydrolase
LLTAWLGSYYIELATQCPDLAPGRQPKIQTRQSWIESHVGNNLNLPEHVAEDLNVPSYYSIWTERWGDISSPLLWSHAKYIILRL